MQYVGYNQAGNFFDFEQERSQRLCYKGEQRDDSRPVYEANNGRTRITKQTENAASALIH